MKHSHSSIKCFENCPRLYKEKYITYSYREPKSQYADWGTTVHKHLEDRVKKGVPLPTELSTLVPIMDIIEKYPGAINVEQKLAVDAQLRPVEYKDKSAWVRAIVDLTKINGSAGFVTDYKTGNVRDDDSQLQLSSVLLMANHPELQSILAMFLWSKVGKITKLDIKREQYIPIWDSFMYRIRKIEDAAQDDNFVPRRSWLCAYCHLKTCEFCPN